MYKKLAKIFEVMLVNGFMFKQRTIKASVSSVGIGVHSGKKVRLCLKPAPADTGVIFTRTDLSPAVSVRATAENVGDTRLASVLTNSEGIRISTVEHLMSAVAGLGIDNLFVEVSAEEIPIMDGSAAPFSYMLQSAGIVELKTAKKFLVIKKPVFIEDGEKYAILEPYNGFKVTFSIDFNHPVVKNSGQFASFDFSQVSFIKEISRARTFGFAHEVEVLRSMGLARGGSFENAIVLDEYRMLNSEELRYKDEFVRHKILDAIGDLYMIGHPIIGAFSAHKSGHALNNALLRKLIAYKKAFDLVTFDGGIAAPPNLVFERECLSAY